MCGGEFCRRWSRSPERKRSKVWRRAASPGSSSSSDTGGGGQRFLEQEGRRRAGRAGRFGTGAAADARANHVRARRSMHHRPPHAICAPLLSLMGLSSCICNCCRHSTSYKNLTTTPLAALRMHIWVDDSAAIL